MNEYELPSFDDDEVPDDVRSPEMHPLPDPVVLGSAPRQHPGVPSAASTRQGLPRQQEEEVTFDTSTSVHTIPERMTAVPIKCRCGGKLGYRDPKTPRIWCGGCGRNL